jgi:hypothetical protein
MKPQPINLSTNLVDEMITELRELYADDQLSRSEKKFMDNIIAKTELGEFLSDAEFEQLCDIHEEYFS